MKQGNQNKNEGDVPFQSLFDHMLNGFAYCKMVFENDKPVDFIYLNVNNAFEKITGLNREHILGKKVTEVIPDIKEAHPELFDMYGEAARTRKESSFVIEFKPLNKWLSVSVYSPREGYFAAIFEDITERKLAGTYADMGREVLQILNESADLEDSIQCILARLKAHTGFDAVGIRLKEGDDFPFFTQNGFSRDFLLTENSLVERSVDGGVCRDKDGKVRLECTCGLVLSGKTDSTNPLFTPGGSCWTNNSFPLLEIPLGQDPRYHPRNQCIHQGYASVALVPIRIKDRIVGLIQFNDRRKGCFTLETVGILEGIASHIGESLMRKRTDEALRESEDRYRRLLESTTDYIYTVRVENGRAVETTHGFGCVAVTGYTHEEYKANPDLWYHMVHVDDRTKVVEMAARAVAGQEVMPMEHRIYHRDGTISWLRDMMVVKYDEMGRVVSYDGLVRNITVRKRAEEALRNSEEFLSRIIDSVADPIFVKDREHRWVLLNKAFYVFMGRTADQIKGRSDYDFFPKEEADVFWAKDEEVFLTGLENVNEEFFTDEKGVRRTIITKKTLYKDEA
ncbi:MAG: PAS domain S-box protein, partial [Candidatus Omnitrophica bacterium]|nr:PAS domain S-box protein [Candidatus Omnitrophota bacterium]